MHESSIIFVVFRKRRLKPSRLLSHVDSFRQRTTGNDCFRLQQVKSVLSGFSWVLMVGISVFSPLSRLLLRPTSRHLPAKHYGQHNSSQLPRTSPTMHLHRARFPGKGFHAKFQPGLRSRIRLPQRRIASNATHSHSPTHTVSSLISAQTHPQERIPRNRCSSRRKKRQEPLWPLRRCE